MDSQHQVYAVGQKEYSSKSEALAEISRQCGVILTGADWTDVTTFQDVANNRQVYRLLADLSGLRSDDTHDYPQVSIVINGTVAQGPMAQAH